MKFKTSKNPHNLSMQLYQHNEVIFSHFNFSIMQQREKSIILSHE